MYSTKLSRIAHRAGCAPSAAVQRGSQCVSTRSPGQRRHSSSKASCPPDSNPSGGKTAPAAKPDNTTAIVEPVLPQQRSDKRLPRTKRPRAATAPKQGDHFAALPTVPSTHHIPPSDICVSNFFSLHRPLSLTTTIPPPSTTAAFDTIFQTRQSSDPWENGDSAQRRPEDVIYALQNTVDSLEREANGSRDEGVRWEIVQEGNSTSDGIKHLDSIPRQKSFDELVAQFKPFRAPPPPEPFPEDQKLSDKKKASKAQQQLKQQLSKSQSRQKSYSTTIIVTESTSEDGQRTYTASSSPIVPVPELESPPIVGESLSQSVQLRYRFAQRMRQRQQASLHRQRQGPVGLPSVRTFVKRLPYMRRKNMLLISVKRQRKLKMKKHKYKKLMKRTRNLRRRQDRA